MVLDDGVEDVQNPAALNKSSGFFLSLIVPKSEIKSIKQALEANGLLDKTLKITPFARGSNDCLAIPPHEVENLKRAIENWKPAEGTGSDIRPAGKGKEYLEVASSRSDSSENKEQKYMIPTSLEVLCTTHQDGLVQANRARGRLLQKIGLPDQTGVEVQLDFRSHLSKHLRNSDRSHLAQAIRRWLLSLPSRTRSILPADPDSLLGGCKWTCTVYSPMLLLPPTFLSKDPWPKLLAGPLKPHLPGLCQMICRQLKVTHIAVNGPIPVLLPSTPASSNGEGALEPNTLRSPINLTPLHGDFGKPNLPPRPQNLQDAFWVRTVQNDITQVWAPMYTMFSRGNLSEKTRLLRLESLKPAAAKRSSAADLYAGIGYFAFSYAKAGVEKVLCWDLNRWSIEGLKRGAEKNGWTTKVVEDTREEIELVYNQYNDDRTTRPIKERFLVFHESYRDAPPRVSALRNRIPPVRHVNCGYLPTSSDSWAVAMNVLDHTEGGWIHAHENVAVKDIQQRRDEVVETFTRLAEPYHTSSEATSHFDVECQHVERVKTYAPGIVHCVFDIFILPKSP
ncbi:MAG: hypothetical protein Q9201_004508 [Fulgogasparrea decipioides]